MGACVVCTAKTSGSLEFCKKHFKEHESDIRDKKPWVRILKNEEQKERRRRKREYEDVSLDQIIDAYATRGR